MASSEGRTIGASLVTRESVRVMFAIVRCFVILNLTVLNDAIASPTTYNSNDYVIFWIPSPLGN